MFNLSSEPLDPQHFAAGLAHPEAGALAAFEGWVRRHNDGREVASLEYEAYEELACAEGGRIMSEAAQRFGLLGVHGVHRVGRLQIGELAVWVGAVAPHRREALEACAWIIDQVKGRVPIWKKEHYVSGEAAWVNCACGALAFGRSQRTED